MIHSDSVESDDFNGERNGKDRGFITHHVPITCIMTRLITGHCAKGQFRR